MRSPEEVYSEIEEDRATREREIRLVGNAAKRASTDDERDMLLRVAVLVTYAHLEGACRFALNAYVAAINALGLPCSEVSYDLVAATLTKVFAALRNPNSKHPVFSGIAPDDHKLHLAAREKEFMEKLDIIVKSPVTLPDNVVDAESNLSSVVLKKNLFRLGLPFDEVDKHKGTIDMLLGVRNAIAHGDTLAKPEQKTVDGYVASAFLVMQFVQQEVFLALRDRKYQRGYA